MPLEHEPTRRRELIRLANPDDSELGEMSAVHETWDVRRLVLNALAELRRRWLLASTVFFAVVAGSAAYAVFAVPTFTSRGALQVAAPSEGLGKANPLMDLMGVGGASDVASEVAIIRRPGFLLKSFKSLGLQWVNPSEPKLLTTDLDVTLREKSPISAELRDVRSHLGGLALRASVIHTATVSLRRISETSAELSFLVPPAPPLVLEQGKPIAHELVEGTFESLPRLEEPIRLELLSDGALAKALASRVFVVAPGSKREPTTLIEISFTYTDRETARSMVQSLMTQYLDQSLAWQTLSASKSAEFVAGQLAKVGATLEQDEAQLSEFSKKEKAVQLDAQAEATIQEVSAIEAELLKTDMQAQGMQYVLDQLKKNGGSSSLTGNFFEDPVLAVSIGELTKLETQYATMRASLRDDHPMVVELGKQLELHRNEIKAQIESARRNIGVQRGALQSKKNTALSQLVEYPEKELELARHVRKVEVNQRLYSFLLEKLQETSIIKASTTIDKRIVDDATMPYLKESPNRGQLVSAGVLFGCLLAALSVFCARAFKRELDTIEAIKEAVPFPLYGQVPVVDTSRPGAVIRDEIWQEHFSPAAEAYRALCVAISMLPHAERARVIQITSSLSGEGKSTVACNLATALRRSGQRVLVVDCDLRKPVQHRIWGIPRSPGLSDAIVGSPEVARDSIKIINEGPHVVAAGTRSPDTVAPFMGSGFRNTLKPLASQYDYILLDCAPAFVAETALVCGVADLVLLVTRPGRTGSAEIKQAVEIVQRTAEVPCGLLINAVTKTHLGYGGQSYHYYGGAYGKDATEGKSANAS